MKSKDIKGMISFRLMIITLFMTSLAQAKMSQEKLEEWHRGAAKALYTIGQIEAAQLKNIKPPERRLSDFSNFTENFTPEEAIEAAANDASNGLGGLGNFNSNNTPERTCPVNNPLLQDLGELPRNFGEDKEYDANGQELPESNTPGQGTPSTNDTIKMLTSYFPPGSGNYNMDTLGKNGRNLFCESANAIFAGQPHPSMSDFPDSNTHCETAVYLSTLKILKDRNVEIDKTQYGCSGSRGSFELPPMFAKLQDRDDAGFKEAFVDTGLIPEDYNIETDQGALKNALEENKPKAGDPLYINRIPKGGHSVIFSHFELEGEKISKLCYWSSNKSGNIGSTQSGYGERCEVIEGKHSGYHFFHFTN